MVISLLLFAVVMSFIKEFTERVTRNKESVDQAEEVADNTFKESDLHQQ
jgi:hypothetical protein